MVTSVVNKR